MESLQQVKARIFLCAQMKGTMAGVTVRDIQALLDSNKAVNQVSDNTIEITKMQTKQPETKSELIERVRKAAEAGSLLSLTPADILKLIEYFEGTQSAACRAELAAFDSKLEAWGR